MSNALLAEPVDLRPDWSYETSGRRQHYTIQALQEGRVIGRAHGSFEPNSDFVIDKIEMLSKHRSRGYGTLMIDEMRRKARALRCTDFVFRGVMSSNVRAIGLYESMGALPVHAVDDLYDFVISPP